MKIYNYIFILCFLCLLPSCDKDFEKVNTDPNAALAEDFHPGYLFTTAQMETGLNEEHSRTDLYYFGAFVQHWASLSNVGIFNWHGDKYVLHEGNNDVLWTSTYEIAMLLEEVLEFSRENPEYHNLYHMASIWKAFVFHRATDAYGDIPYSEAGQAFYKGIYKPKYDSQESIYDHMLNMLDQSVEALDPGAENFGKFDIVYDGNIAQWKRMGNSLMLRLAMRLSKADPAKSEQWVKKAFARELLEGNSDNLMIKAVDPNATVQELSNDGSFMFSRSATGQVSATFFNFLKERNDPRLKYMVAVYTDPYDAGTKNDDPAIQKGLPNGLDRFTLVDDPSYDPANPAQENQYSTLNRTVYGKLDGVRMLMTYAEVQFLLAEASIRGWVSGEARTYYENGVKADMENVAGYDKSAVISEAEIQQYLSDHPFAGTDEPEEALRQINHQYWIATFMNGYEAYANFRRSGYPELVPVNYPDNETGGRMPGRLIYPKNEAVLNEANYKEAVARQGADNFITRVWWDQ